MKYLFGNFITGLKIVAILCGVSMLYLLFIGELSLDPIKRQILYNLFYGLPLSMVNGVFFDKMDDWMSWEVNPRRRAWAGVIGSILLTMITIFLCNYIMWVVIWGNDTDVLFSDRNRVFYIIAFIITVIISAILHSVKFFDWAQNEKIINEKLRKEKAEMELSALKAHVDPHFLFNSFNTLSGLIDEDPKKAQKMLGELSGIYRHILETKDDDTNTIQSELNFAKKYLGLQQTRFEDSIQLEVNVDPATMEKKLPSLSLQLLLENAIKHNAFDEDAPLKIRIFNQDENLVVENNKKKRKTLAESSGMGLQNIRDRYKLLTKQDFVIDETTDLFIVKLPVIT